MSTASPRNPTPTSPRTVRFFATTAKMMEPLLADELKTFGAKEVEITRAGVAFSGALEVAYRACLWSRIANRVLLPLKTFHAPDPEKLYGGAKSIRWSDHLTPNETLAVDFSASQSQITHTHYGALKVKDAVCDQFRSIEGVRPSVDAARPDVRINVYLHQDEATVSIDLSGTSLHQRGYREEGTAAPLKENLAAAILTLAGWPELLKQHAGRLHELTLLDPMCGSGTLPIEAALMAARIAPGLTRKHYGFIGWRGHDAALWKRLVDQAGNAIIGDRKALPRIVGYDQDFRAVRTALHNVDEADVHGLVHIEKRELATVERLGEAGLFVCNPPYGERLGDVEELMPLYREIGDTMKKKFSGWRAGVFTSSPDLAKVIGLRPRRRHVLFNGALECRLLEFELYAGSRNE